MRSRPNSRRIAHFPLIDTARLATYFNPAGSAYQRIVHVLSRHRERGWIISNPDNPSTALLLELEVHQFARSKYEVRTKEYWYLRWFSVEENRYRTIYNETNDQMYLVEDVTGVLRVNANIYPCTKPPLVLRVVHNIRQLWIARVGRKPRRGVPPNE